jgi:hypothetical protein
MGLPSRANICDEAHFPNVLIVVTVMFSELGPWNAG